MKNDSSKFSRQVICLVLTLCVLVTVQEISTAEEPRPPNIILIMADDVSWEAFGCYGAEDYKTPELDRLAKQGVRYSHCYSTPICTTSRVQIMTGKYNFRNYTHFGYLNPNERTFGHLLQNAGYKTAIAGKWQLNGLYNSLPGHDDASRPAKAGFDESMLWQVTTGKGSEQGGERFWSPPIEHNGKFLTKETNAGKYGPDMFCDFICDFVDRNQKEPFFVYYPMVLVHDPFVKTPDTIGGNSRATSANKAPKNKDEQKANFVAMVNYMDKIVGRIVKKVDDIGQLENTIILFTADNGTNRRITSRWSGMDIRGGKGGMTDMGTHVPLIAYWKGHTPEDHISNDLIDFTDFYATIAEAAVTAEETYDGRSFFPQLCGKPGKPRDSVFCHYEPYWNKKAGQFVRNDRFKLYRDGRMFRLPDDLREQNDLGQSSDSSVTDARDRLGAILKLAPPAPKGTNANRNTKNRPVFPEWQSLQNR